MDALVNFSSSTRGALSDFVSVVSSLPLQNVGRAVCDPRAHVGKVKTDVVGLLLAIVFLEDQEPGCEAWPHSSWMGFW